MPSKYLGYFISGKSIKIGTLDEYRKLDSHALTKLAHQVGLQTLIDEGGIEDPTEGRTMLHESRKETGGVVYRNVSAVNEFQNCFIFSASTSSDIFTAKRIISDSIKRDPKQPYDVCLPIVETSNFLHALVDGFLKTKFGPSLIGAMHGDVEYVDITGSLSNPPPPASPFQKSIHFSAQNESRIVFDCNIPRRQSGMIISADFKPNYFGDPIFFDEKGVIVKASLKKE